MDVDLDAVADALKELGASLRSMALALGLLAVRMSSSDSDTAVIRVPKGLRPFRIGVTDG
jgi:hypothetical protein